MPKRSKRAKVNDDPIILVDNPMKAKHAKPPVDVALQAQATTHSIAILCANNDT